MSKQTTLGESQITQSPNDDVVVELVEPDDLPPMVKITWPEQPSIVEPQRFGDTAAALVKLFSAAHVELARFRARRHLS